MTPKLKHWIYDHHLILTLFSAAVVFVLWGFIPSLGTTQFLGPALASVFGFYYFVLKQHLEEIRLFKELFSEFNDRYNKINGELFRILQGPQDKPLTSEEIVLLFDYFNLCAEEFLYYRKGFIYPEVWRAWFNGMRIFRDNPRIRKLWEDELKNNSYYGFQIPCCERLA
jgi:hypothetical protein